MQASHSQDTGIWASDKAYWHQYVAFYDQHFPTSANRIVEFGVLNGASIHWLLQRYPQAHITGIDILPIQPQWPRDERVRYVQMDQGNRAAIHAFFSVHNGFDLIIEDGSHFIAHQHNCLLEALGSVRSGGLYVLEDAQTCLPTHPFYREAQQKQGSNAPLATALSVLLALEHLRKLDRRIDLVVAENIAGSGFITPQEVIQLDAMIETISIYQRTTLPNRCYSCGTTDYDYKALKCRCGIDTFSRGDSMACLIRKRN